jgi:hypothetical protein
MAALIAYIIKSMNSRIDKLETSEFLNEAQARILIADKLDPIKEDIQEIKVLLMKVIDSVCFNK